MTKANLKTRLLTITENPDNSGLQLFFVLKQGDSFELLQPALDSEVLEPKLKKDFIKEIKDELLPENEDWEYEYESLNIAEATDKRRVYHIRASEIPMAKALFDLATDEGNIGEYKPGDHELTTIWGIIIKLATPEKAIYIFKRNYPINVIKKDKFYPVFFTNGSLKLEEKELLRVSKSIDFLYLEGELIIIKKDDFERSFDYLAAVEARAKAGIDIILDSKLLLDASKVYDLAQKRGEVKKILSISADNPVFKKSARQIVNFAKKYGHVISISEDKTKLELKNQKEAKAFLKILNDDYLHSEMTENRYDSKGKQKVEASQ